MKPLYLILVILSSCLSSCISNKYVYRCNTLYEAKDVTPAGEGTSFEITPYKFKKGFKATITDNGNHLVVTPDGSIKQTSGTPKTHSGPFGDHRDLLAGNDTLAGKKYFPETTYFPTQKKFRYFDTKPVLQTLTVPIKIRPALNKAEYLDSFPSQVEANVNVGVAFGWKLQHNVYAVKKGIFGQTTNRFSLVPGIYLGIGATDLKAVNTRPKIQIERKAAVVNLGAFFMIGINSINIGYAGGMDVATGPGSSDWVYNKKWWHGFAFSIDLIK